MSAHPGPLRPARLRRCAHLLAMTLLAACPMAAVGKSAAGAPTGTTESSAHRSVTVGGLRYADGAGTRRWGLRPHAAWSTRVIKPRFRVRTVHGYRPSNSSDHGSRCAADFMVRRHAKGDRVARFSRRHHRQLNVSYVIWDQRIWSVERAREGWRRMVDAGSATANHKDHVHVSYWRAPRDDTFRP